MLLKYSLSFNGETVCSIKVIPINSIPKPINIFAIFLVLFFLLINSIAAPIAITNGANDDGFISVRNILSEETSPNLKI